jgi:hypothetical protein
MFAPPCLGNPNPLRQVFSGNPHTPSRLPSSISSDPLPSLSMSFAASVSI